jgi:hypothetical protein
MRLGNRFTVSAALLLMLAPGRWLLAADDKDKAPQKAAIAAAGAESKETILRKLDVAAKTFRTTTADFQFHSIQTDPVFDDEVQEGTVYYERKGTSCQMAGHIAKVNGKPVPKIYTYSHGVFQLYEKLIDQITTFKTGNKAEGYVILGFGASGKDLEEKWEIKYLGPESLPDGKTIVKTEKLELVAKDAEVRKNISKVIVWIDPERAISLKQIIYEGPSERRENFFFNIKVNQPQPEDAYTFKTDSKTQMVNH